MLTRSFCCIGLLFAAAGCQATDPYQREGMWRPNGSNDTNLRLMVAVPSHLAMGVGTDVGDGRQAAMALDRLRADKLKQLPDTGLTNIVVQSTGSVNQAPQ